MAKVAMPPMKQYGYSDSLASASIAAGGTLGILIPPSIASDYLWFVNRNQHSRPFAAGLLPGILACCT